MRDLYLADPADWQNPSELLEWLGFFEGAAIVHWALVRSIAERFSLAALLPTAESALAFHHTLLHKAAEAIGKNV